MKKKYLVLAGGGSHLVYLATNLKHIAPLILAGK